MPIKFQNSKYIPWVCKNSKNVPRVLKIQTYAYEVLEIPKICQKTNIFYSLEQVRLLWPNCWYPKHLLRFLCSVPISIVAIWDWIRFFFGRPRFLVADGGHKVSGLSSVKNKNGLARMYGSMTVPCITWSFFMWLSNQYESFEIYFCFLITQLSIKLIYPDTIILSNHLPTCSRDLLNSILKLLPQKSQQHYIYRISIFYCWRFFTTFAVEIWPGVGWFGDV